MASILERCSRSASSSNARAWSTRGSWTKPEYRSEEAAGEAVVVEDGSALRDNATPSKNEIELGIGR